MILLAGFSPQWYL